MMFWRAVWLVSSLIFSSVACAGESSVDDRTPASLRAWDDILSATLFADFADFEYIIEQHDHERVYAYSLSDTFGDPLFLVWAWVGQGGTFLSPADWQAAKADPAARARDFPEIGARAYLHPSTFGPDGAISGVTFTTSDGSFDVEVNVFDASSAEERPWIGPEEAARRLAAAYDASLR